MTTNAVQQNQSWTSDAETIVRLIQAGDPRGEEMLYAAFTRGLRYLAIRKVGYEQADECVHDTFIALAKKIREGALREPAALLKYARTILERMIVDIHLERRKWRADVDFDYLALTHADQAPTPDMAYESSTRSEVMKRALQQLRPKEREILVRFYIQEEDQEKIRREMNLTHTQYRLLKSRSKSKLEQFTASYLKKPAAQQPSTTAVARAACV
ncbi:MAG TPA: sigma-70 family RNA polymerase sigma factor [Bryobacteraceae bacterium]|nr:sigma-70 family RNA polymerase sigma factor [Bryobacteraceae bacterium]